MERGLASYSDAVLKTCYDNITTIAGVDTVDLMDQVIMLKDMDGTIALINTGAIDELQTTLVISAAIFASQLGAALAIAVVLLLMTSSDKFRTLPFIFNVLALLCDIIRCILQIAQLTGGLSQFLIVQLAWYQGPNIPEAVAVSVAGSIFTFLLFVCIELALITQVRVVCAATNKLQRSIISWSTIVVGLTAIAFRLNLLVLNIHATTHLGDSSDHSQEMVTKAQSMANISGIVSICIFSAIFCVKLALAIQTRHTLGLKQFGPIQIIFIMGCQTLILPAIFAILAYYVLHGAQVGSVVETIVAIFLPLSSIWASANTNAKLNSGHHVAAVMALPAYRAKPDPSPTATLVNPTTAASTDGLTADERYFQAKYGHELQDSSMSIDRYDRPVAQDIEVEHPALRT